jgi:hypothetical protein
VGTPEHVRNSVVYLHLNPVRAGLCATPDEYAWTSHGAWIGNATACDGAAEPVALDRALHLFASRPDRCRDDLIADYLAFMNWRIRFDQCAAAAAGQVAQPPLVLPPRPPVEHGDLAWLRGMTPRPLYTPKPAEEVAPQLTGARPRLDLADIARAVVAESGTGIDLSTVRSRWGGPTHRRVRDAIILRAAAAGYSGVQIAAYLHISPSAVSRSLVRDRRKLLGRRG